MPPASKSSQMIDDAADAALKRLAELLVRSTARAWLAGSAAGAPADDTTGRCLTDTSHDRKEKQ